MCDKSILNDIKKYSSMGKLSVFVGAGVSALSGFPSWSSLIKNMANEIDYTYKIDSEGNAIFSSEELLKIPQVYYIMKGETDYENKIKENFSDTYSTNEVYDLILSLQPNHILTTNYDNLIEKTAAKFGRNFSVLNSNDVVSKAETTNYIVKVHGDFTSKFVLKEQDYLNYEQDFILIDNIVKNIFATNLVIFIGYGLNDYNIKLILNWVRQAQSSSFIMPIFIHTGDKIDCIEVKYQEERGLRILDCNQYTGSQEYKEQYTSILKFILYSDKYDTNSKKEEKLEYLYNKVSGISNLNYIRRRDFNSIFKNEYELNDKCEIINKTTQYLPSVSELGVDEKKEIKIDYFEDFFENIEEYQKINTRQCILIDDFIRKSGAKLKKKDCIFNVLNIEIDSLVFKSDFIEIKKYCLKEYINLKDNYKKAYFLAQLGDYSASYRLYTSILNTAISEEKWDIYYFTQVNRYYLFLIINNAIYLSTGFQGAINYGKDIKLFSDAFLDELNYEMGKLDIKKLYYELPYDIKNKYAFLKTFSNFNYDNYYELIKNKYQIEKDYFKKIISFTLSKFDKVKLDMLEMEKFIYENMILFDVFDENKTYIKISIMSWFKSYIDEISKDEYSTSNIFSNREYTLTVQDVILMTKTFEKDDINYFDILVNKREIPFEETNDLEKYLYKNTGIYEEIFGTVLEGSDILLWTSFNKEIKNLISIAPYFVKCNDCKLKVIDFVCEMLDVNFTVLDRIALIKKWIDIADVKKASPIIEKWFEKEYNNFIDEYVNFIDEQVKQVAYHIKISYIEAIGGLLCEVSKKDNYISEIISNIILNGDSLVFNSIKNIYPVLNDDARKIYDNNHNIVDIFELMERGYENNLPIDCNEEEIIAKFLSDVLYKKQNNLNKSQETILSSEDEKITKIAIYMYIKKFPFEFTKKYATISDEYDFLLNIDAFEYEKFKIDWLYSYSDDLINKIKDNEKQREIVITAICSNGLNCKKEEQDKLFKILVEFNNIK